MIKQKGTPEEMYAKAANMLIEAKKERKPAFLCVYDDNHHENALLGMKSVHIADMILNLLEAHPKAKELIAQYMLLEKN